MALPFHPIPSIICIIFTRFLSSFSFPNSFRLALIILIDTADAVADAVADASSSSSSFSF